jgi:hypothetical protein
MNFPFLAHEAIEVYQIAYTIISQYRGPRYRASSGDPVITYLPLPMGFT